MRVDVLFPSIAINGPTSNQLEVRYSQPILSPRVAPTKSQQIPAPDKFALPVEDA